MAFLTGNVWLNTLAVIVPFFVIVIAYLKSFFKYWKRRGVYTIPPSVPFGNATNLVLQKEFIGVTLKNTYDILKAKGLKYGGFYFFGKPVFIPVDLDLIKLIMTKDFAHFADRIFYADSDAEPLAGHILLLKGLKWKTSRSQLTPTFSSTKLKMMFQTLVDCTKELIVVTESAIKMNEALEFKDVSRRFAMDVIGSCAFGIECNCLKDLESPFLKFGKLFFDTSSSVWDCAVRFIQMMNPEILRYFKFRTIRKDITDFFMNAVTETVNYREKNNTVRNDFMHLLIQLKKGVSISEKEEGQFNNTALVNDYYDTTGHKTKTSLTINEIAAHCFGFFLAGFETSSTTITFCMYELAKNPKLQDNLREEINTVLTRNGGKITYDALMEMTYMDKCINETLRKYPPVSLHTRECTQTYTIPNSSVVIKKGIIVFIPVLGIHNDPEYYPNPDKFDPERFSDEGKSSRHPSAWIPFGDGPRICIALRFARMQVKVALTTLLKDYEFRLNSKTPSPLVIDPKTPFVLSAKGGIWFNAEKAV